jgi:hypothetical protein
MAGGEAVKKNHSNSKIGVEEWKEFELEKRN